MTSSFDFSSEGVQALIVFTDPVCVYCLDLVHEGLTSEAEIAARAAERIGVTVEHAAAVLDGLIGVGYIGRAGLTEIADLGLDDFAAHFEKAMDQLEWLRSKGEGRQVDDILVALDAAWNTRSADPAKRLSAAQFRASAAGRRHAARLEARSLGHVSAVGVAEGARA
ncbi:hypothetical protein [Frondihabitans sp. Leaf304]|uniref:hypothetical protein n=1 Tax=Frondihabitans sp. Leaf304 TaxID=1736329 RepID=UPI0007012630|nr:hypothetical protein [Frondihabitans sp. Leaf304]KQQ26787.1 hypothetical protein ASF54_12580 [Frondihabitans sp. Leaf304]